MARHLWECQLPRTGRVTILPEAEWRYFVIAFRGTNAVFAELEHAFDLATVELEIAFTMIYSEHGIGMALDSGGRLFQVLQQALYESGFFVDLGKEQVDEISGIYGLLHKADPKVLDLTRILRELSGLKGLPYRSPLRFLGYFAVLESLLTHPPQPTDPYDSITRQIAKTLTLLNNRLPRRIDYGRFGGFQPERIWKTMYECRSTVAHGGQPDFTRGGLKHLRSYDQALGLVRETAKAVILQALREPQLLVDLREC